MTCSPILTRLQCGATPLQLRGFWEEQGYGIFGAYKSDLLEVGGMNVLKFTNRWDAEDWDRVLNAGYEVERLKLKNFYHFFHIKKGMWHEMV